MGLDAHVHCNCFETGRLKEPPPISPELVDVEPDGSLTCQSDDINLEIAFDQWLLNRACEHADGIFLHHRIGNIGRIALLREELGCCSDKFPMILTRVIYSGTHCGDYIKTDEIAELREEVEKLAHFSCAEYGNQQYLDEFRDQMRELIQASVLMAKPIVF